MLRVDYRIEYGVIKVRQERNDGSKVFTIKIHWANALCAFIHHRVDEEGTKWADLVSWFADEGHLKRFANECDGDCLAFLYGDIVSVKLNLYYKESMTLLKHIVKSGHKVTCYYKEPKKK